MTTRQLSFKGPPQLAIAAGATSPNPSINGVLVWSTTENALVVWDGNSWELSGSGGGPTQDSISAPLSFDTPYGVTATADGYGGVGWDGATPSNLGTGAAGTVDGSNTILNTWLHNTITSSASTYSAAGLGFPTFRTKKGNADFGGLVLDCLCGFTPSANGIMFMGVHGGNILFSDSPSATLTAIGIGGFGSDDLNTGFRIFFGNGTTFNSSTWISRSSSGTRNNPIYHMYLRVVNGSNTANIWLKDYGIAGYPEGILTLDNYSVNITSLSSTAMMEAVTGYGTGSSTAAKTFRSGYLRVRHFKNNEIYQEAATNITGNAATATTLYTPRNIQGVSFNGSSNIDIISIGSVAPSNPVTNQLWIQTT